MSQTALSGRENECARTDTVFFLISEVSEGTVSLTVLLSLAVIIFVDCAAQLPWEQDQHFCENYPLYDHNLFSIYQNINYTMRQPGPRVPRW